MLRRRIWDFWSRFYDRLWVQAISLGPTRIAVRKLVEGICYKEGLTSKEVVKILDIGCGTGQLLRDLKNKFKHFKIMGMDVSYQMLQQAQRKNGNVFLGDAEKLPLHKEAIDIAISTHAIPYVRDLETFFQKVKDSVKKDGYFIVACANKDTWWDYIVAFFIKLTVFFGIYWPSSYIEMTGKKTGWRLLFKRKIIGFPFFSITIFLWQKQEMESKNE